MRSSGDQSALPDLSQSTSPEKSRACAPLFATRGETAPPMDQRFRMYSSEDDMMRINTILSVSGLVLALSNAQASTSGFAPATQHPGADGLALRRSSRRDATSPGRTVPRLTRRSPRGAKLQPRRMPSTWAVSDTDFTPSDCTDFRLLGHRRGRQVGPMTFYPSIKEAIHCGRRLWLSLARANTSSSRMSWGAAAAARRCCARIRFAAPIVRSRQRPGRYSISTASSVSSR